jgi:hypothetical protein
MGKKRKNADASSGSEDYDDDMPNMSMSAPLATASTTVIQPPPAPTRPEHAAAELIIERWWPWFVRQREQRSQCPFNPNMLTMAYSAINDAELRTAIKTLPLRWDQRKAYEIVIGGDCCCKGTSCLTAAELKAHAHQVSSGRTVHSALSQFLASKGFGREQEQPVRPAIKSMAAVEETAWPPLIELKAPPAYEELIKSKSKACQYLKAVTKASGYVPIYTVAGAKSHEPRMNDERTLTDAFRLRGENAAPI